MTPQTALIVLSILMAMIVAVVVILAIASTKVIAAAYGRELEALKAHSAAMEQREPSLAQAAFEAGKEVALSEAALALEALNQPWSDDAIRAIGAEEKIDG